MLFTSRLCDVCNNALRIAFESLKDRRSDTIAHHATKESLVDSVLHRSCHLCRLIIYHLKLSWAAEHRQGIDDLKEEPTTLTEEDFKDSDFDFASFPSDRVIVRSYMLELPEDINLHTLITKYGDGSDGVFGLVAFDCNSLNHDYIDAAIQRFWIFDERAFGVSPITSRLNDSTSSANCQAMLEVWLKKCSDNHTCTSQEPSFLPTRLLDLDEVDTKGQVRLVLSQDIDQHARYVTLSHCWGGDVPFQLREETREKMIEGFELEDMPKTFRDAIAVAGWANIRYIWIDSCCIIQGSASDWEREAKTMQKVYRHTYFNISADHSENSHGGLFHDRLAYKYTPCPYVAPKIGKVFFLPQFDMTNVLIESTIATRAWVTQERFLSPRILHFTTDQLFWECAGLYACETFPRGAPHVYDNLTSWHYRMPLSLAQTSHEDKPAGYEVWGRICEDYSRARLTYTSDKLIAFAGIAREFQSRFPNDIYIAGLWNGDLITGLLWKAFALNGWPAQANGSHELYADPYITAAMPPRYRAPSWSWLAKDCAIFWQTQMRHSARAAVEILEVHVDLVNEFERTGDIKGGHIKLRGLLRAAQWTQDGHLESIVIDGKSGNQLLVPPEDPLSSKADSFLIQRDTGMEFPVKDIFCLPIRLSVSQRTVSFQNPIIEGLILMPTKDENIFERIGYFEANGEGYCLALLYELCAPELELEQPWATLDLRPMAPEEAAQGNAILKFKYNEEHFRQVKESVVTIV